MAGRKRGTSWRDGTSDSPVAARARIEAAASDPARVTRIRQLIEVIHRLIAVSPDYASAVTARGRMGSLDMGIRKFHDQLGWDVRGALCRGAIYRSAGAVALAARGALSEATLHCEHTIPLACFARIVHRRGRGMTIEALADLLLTHSVVTAMSREERHGPLRRRRACVPGGRVSAWSRTHPEISEIEGGDVVADPGMRPFLRYVGTGIAVSFYPDGDGAAMPTETLTWEEHRKRVRSFALFRAETDFGGGSAVPGSP